MSATLLHPSHTGPITAAAHSTTALRVIEPAATQGPKKTANLDLVRRLHALRGRRIPGTTAHWSNSTFARGMGTSAAYISRYMAQLNPDGKTPNPSAPALEMSLETFEQGVEQFLAQIAERRTRSNNLFETAITRQFTEWVNVQIASKQWGIFYGPGGDGKTSAMQLFALRNPLAILVSAWEWARGPLALKQAIFKELNKAGSWKGGTPHMQFIISKLSGSEHVLLVDNFHQLTPSSFTFLSNLQDCTGITIICAGNPRGLERAQRDEQIASRIKAKEFATFGAAAKGPEGTRRANLRDAALKLLSRDAPDYADAILPMALQVMEHRGTLRALESHIRAMNAYLTKTGLTGDENAVKAFRAAHELLIHDDFSLD